MAEDNQEKPKSEESPLPTPAKVQAAPRPEEGTKPGTPVKRSLLNRTSLLWAALFGALLMNSILLGIVSVKPSRIVEKNSNQSHSNQLELPDDVPNPERHIDILLGMADAERRSGNHAKALELYNKANRAFEGSIHADVLRRSPLNKAEVLFEHGRYREARNSYFAFLAVADNLPTESQRLVQQAHFRIAQCYLKDAVQDTEHIAVPEKQAPKEEAHQEEHK